MYFATDHMRNTWIFIFTGTIFSALLINLLHESSELYGAVFHNLDVYHWYVWHS